jgi:hypothetical protein
VNDRDYGHAMALGVDSVDDPVGPSASAVPICERRPELFANAVRIVQQRADDDLVSSEGHRLGENLGELTASCR